MIKRLLTVIILASISFLFSQTIIPGGDVSGNWSVAGSPYLIEGEITIPNGQILTIDPGCSIEFQGHYKFNVQGQLLAEGTEQDSIYFTALDTDIGWNGIRFNNTPTTNDSTKIVHCFLMNGIAEGYPPDLRGGAIFVRSFPKILISDSRFENNQALDSQYVGGGGYENGTGGAISLFSNANILVKRTLFLMNEGHSGGAIYCSGSQPTFIYCNFFENNTTGRGGGISTWEASIEVRNCIFFMNSAEHGGAIYLRQQLESNIVNNIFSNNSAIHGGAIYSLACDNGYIVNNLLCNNYAVSGGGLLLGFFEGEIINCSLVNNEALYGGAIYFHYSDEPSLINTIIYDNNSINEGDQVYLHSSDSDPYFLFCDVDGGVESFGGPGAGSYNIAHYQNCIEVDPMFVLPSVGYGLSTNGLLSDFSLDTYSPCIEAGDPEIDLSLLPLLDIAGNQRLIFDFVDMGAYEHTSYFSDFMADPQSGDVPLTVQFYDESIGLPTFWEWDFNNDSIIDSYEQNPQYTYELYGNYSVSLLSGNDTQSDLITKPNYINVNYSLISQFSANILSGYAPLEISFTDGSYGDIITWEWDFNNDGIIDSYLQDPTWEYTDLGVYSVSLTVSDGLLEDTLLKEDYITIFPDNVITGIIAEDLILEADTVNVIGEVTVLDGVTLTIDPGVTMLFHDHYKLNIQGRLLAEGTEQDSIYFTALDTDIGWHGIRFDNTPATNDSSKIVYCHLEHGKAVGENWSEQSGGAFYINDFSKILISHCKFINNYASSSGGAICDYGSIRIDNSIISYNQSGNEGGGISINGYSTNKLINLTINYNSALTGGGLYLESNSEIINCKITNNNTYGIYIYNTSPKITNSIICNNSSTGIYAWSEEWSESYPSITNCTVTNNGGYGIYYYEFEWWPRNGKIKSPKRQNKNNKDRSVVGKNIIFSGNASGSIGYILSSPNLIYSAFSGNIPSFAGIGCISTEPYFVDPTGGVGINHNALEADWSLQSNSICIDHGTPDTTGLYLPDLDLAGNSRVYQGQDPRVDIGAYEFQGEPDQIPDIIVNPYNIDFGWCTVNEFSLEKSFVISNIGFYDLVVSSIIAPECFLIKREDDLEFGSAIDQFTVDADSMETINVIFNPNSAFIYSDNIMINSNDPDENVSTVGVTGIGDIYPVVYGNISEDTIWEADTIKVTGNILVEDSKTLTITPGTNVRIMGGFSVDVQGRIIAEGLEQDKIYFTSKDSNSWWKGILFDNTPATNDSSKFSYCEFTRSYHSPGGVFYIFNFSKIQFDFCTFAHNKADSYGGAIYADNCDISISNSQFIANEALAEWEFMWSSPGFGGGLYILHSNIELINSIINNNHAHGAEYGGSRGGGIDIYNSELLLQSSQISNNLSSYAGGISSHNSNTKLINCELSANGSQALRLNHSNLDLVNSIISQHDSYNSSVISAGDSTNISLINTIIYHNNGYNNIVFSYVGAANTLYSDYSCIEYGISSIIPYNNTTVEYLENNIEDDPLFIDHENGDFHLQSGSPCINVGTPSGWIVPSLNQPIDEILGYDCIDKNYDIGNFEYQSFLIDQNEIDFGEIPFNTTSQSIQVTITNLGCDNLLITSIEATEYFLIKQNIEDVYSNQIGPIEPLNNSEVTFWIACHPLEDGLLEGEISIHTDAIPSLATIDVCANVSMIDILRLFPNYPNPFNTETTFKFLIPDDSFVRLTIYNIKGQKVKTLIDSDRDRGFNTIVWHGLDDNGKQVGTGIYLYELIVDNRSIAVKKCMLLK